MEVQMRVKLKDDLEVEGEEGQRVRLH